MPDAAGNFKGISVPELPWHRERRANADVLKPARPHTNYCPLHDVLFASDWNGRCRRCKDNTGN